MAEPSYGGTNGVKLLDIGQRGGARQSGEQAFATMGVEADQEKIAKIQQAFTQQDYVVQDLLGFRGQQVVWKGTIWGVDVPELQAIEAEIEEYKAGRYRDPSTGVVTTDVTQILPTRLTRSDGGNGTLVLSAEARLLEYRPTGPRQTVVGNPYTVMQEFAIVFEILT